MWTFHIKTGAILNNGLKVGTGYSGYSDAANDSARVAEEAIGPIPPGKYKIGPAYQHAKLGPICMNLDPLPGTDTFGRSAFRIHGDNSTPDPHDGSHGCIVTGPAVRRAINNSRDRILEVVAE
jgi:hypothetical protein